MINKLHIISNIDEIKQVMDEIKSHVSMAHMSFSMFYENRREDNTVAIPGNLEDDPFMEYIRDALWSINSFSNLIEKNNKEIEIGK